MEPSRGFPMLDSSRLLCIQVETFCSRKLFILYICSITRTEV